ncbi:MAG: hypothetical protein AABX24_00435 [Nanoarchaeota archaeon]
MVIVTDVFVPHNVFTDKEIFYRTELLSNFSSSSLLSIYHKDVGYNSDGSAIGTRTVVYAFDCKTDLLQSIDFYRGDFTLPGYNWSKELFEHWNESCFIGGPDDAFNAVKGISEVLKKQSQLQQNKNGAENIKYLLPTLERIIKSH